MKSGSSVKNLPTWHLAFLAAILPTLLFALSCTKRTQDISDMTTHLQEVGLEVEPLDSKRQVKYEGESGAVMYVHEAHIEKGISMGITQENHLIRSIPVTILLFDDEKKVTRTYNRLKERQLNYERTLSRTADYPEYREQMPVSFRPLKNGRFVMVIHHAKIDENGRLRARLQRNHVMIGLIEEAFMSYTVK